nr:thiamine pyrophosphate-binding protein [uncultured Blautia sp.]
MKLYEFVDQCLSKIGVEKVFGVPGALIMPVWQNLKDKEIILCSHEQEASYTATGYAKMTRKPVCVITTGGPGVTNCISGIASANIDSIPLIFISGRTPISQVGLGNRQEESNSNRLFDSTKILSDITKKSVCVNNTEEAFQIIWDTIQMAVKGRCGAVHLSLPIDLQNCEIPEKKLDSFKSLSHVESVKFNVSEKPLLVIGWGCWMADAYEQVYQFAEKINAPIVVSSKAYCCIKRDHKLFLGKLGYGYNVVIDDFIKDYKPDSIISFGSSLGQKDIKGSVIQKLMNEVPTYVIANDCEYVACRGQKIVAIKTDNLNEYIAELCKSTSMREIDNILLTNILRVRRDAVSYWRSKTSFNDDMAKCIEYIGEKCSRHYVILADAGNHLANAGALITTADCGQMFLDVGLRAMGTGICTAVGMAIADSSKRYIAITGDGCMLMNGNVMHLVAAKKLPVIFIVFNNHSLGRVRVGQSITKEYKGTDILNVDFMLYAQAFGLKAYRFTAIKDFFSSFSNIISKEKSALIEIVTDKDEIPVSVKDNVY